MNSNPHKSRSGLNRIWHALRYSLSGLRAAWDEKAFRQEALASFVLLPLAFWIGQSWVEIALLTGTVIVVMVVCQGRLHGHGLRGRAAATGGEAGRGHDGKASGESG